MSHGSVQDYGMKIQSVTLPPRREEMGGSYAEQDGEMGSKQQFFWRCMNVAPLKKNTYSISCMCCLGWLVYIYIYILIHIPFIANWINSKLLKYKTTHPRLPQKKWFQSTCWQMSSWMSIQWKLLRHSTRWRSSVYRWTLNCFRGKEMKKRKETQHNIP